MMAYICTYGLWHLYKVLRNWWRGKEVSIRITERQKKQKNVKCFVWIREIWQKTKKTHTPENWPEVFDFSSVRIEWEHKQIKPFKWTSSPVCEQVDASSFVQLSPRAAQKANHYLWCTESWLFRTTVMTQSEKSGQQQWSHFFLNSIHRRSDTQAVSKVKKITLSPLDTIIRTREVKKRHLFIIIIIWTVFAKKTLNSIT